MVEEGELGSFFSELGPVMVSYKHANEPLGLITGRKFLK